MIKINRTGITSDKVISDDVIKSSNEKYITITDLSDYTIPSVEEAKNNAINAQVLSETAAINAMLVIDDAEVVLNEAVELATDEANQAVANAINAQVLSEVAAVNALEAELTIDDKADVAIQEAALSVTFDSQILSETAAINALNHVEEANDAQILAEVAAVDSLKSKSDSLRAQFLAETAAINALVTKQETYDNQMLAETAAINALVYLEEARAILEEIKGLQ